MTAIIGLILRLKVYHNDNIVVLKLLLSLTPIGMGRRYNCLWLAERSAKLQHIYK
jgi:hypothetical protein